MNIRQTLFFTKRIFGHFNYTPKFIYMNRTLNRRFCSLNNNNKIELKQLDIQFQNKDAMNTQFQNNIDEKYKKELTNNFLIFMEKGANEKIIRKPELVDYYIERGVDISVNNDYALTLACIAGDVDVLKKLEMAGADVEKHKHRLFKIAASHGHFNVLKYLHYKFTIYENYAETYATLAIKNGNLEMVQFLYSICPHINIEECISIATNSDVKKFLKGKINYDYVFIFQCATCIFVMGFSLGMGILFHFR